MRAVCRRGGLRFGRLCGGCGGWGPRVSARRLRAPIEPVDPVDTVDTIDPAGSAETSPNFACNSPQGVLGCGLKSAEYQRSGFNV